MKHGIFLPVFELLISILNKINLVEWFKEGCAYWVESTKKREVKRIAVDIFIILKYIVIFYIWIYQKNNIFLKYTVIYLLFMNFHTYFYYHLWNNLSNDNSSKRMKGRFITFSLAFIYNIISYGYLYAVPFKNNFKWESNFSLNVSAIAMSFSKTIGGSFEKISPITNTGLFLSATQVVITFLFVAVLLGNSIANLNLKEEENGI